MTTLTKKYQFFEVVEADLMQLQLMLTDDMRQYHATLIASALHLMKAGGKRLRPAMALLTARATVHPQPLSRQQHHLYIAMAVELLHTATLIHDDIIDKASVRRGIPTVNHQWDEKTSVLAGDFLLARSCYYISMIEMPRLNTIFAQIVMDMCNGEIAQLNYAFHTQMTVEEYLHHIECKTALLMAVACQGAAVINETVPEVEKAMYQYGQYMGIAFQIIDDILDFSTSIGSIGKPVHNDLGQGKITLPTFFALQSSPKADLLKGMIEDQFAISSDLEKAILIIQQSGAIEKSYQMAEEYIEKAVQALDILPESPARVAMQELAYFSLKRDH